MRDKKLKDGKEGHIGVELERAVRGRARFAFLATIGGRKEVKEGIRRPDGRQRPLLHGRSIPSAAAAAIPPTRKKVTLRKGAKGQLNHDGGEVGRTDGRTEGLLVAKRFLLRRSVVGGGRQGRREGGKDREEMLLARHDDSEELAEREKERE